MLGHHTISDAPISGTVRSFSLFVTFTDAFWVVDVMPGDWTATPVFNDWTVVPQFDTWIATPSGQTTEC